MMDIKDLTQSFFGYTACATIIIISFSGVSCLTFPIPPIVKRVPTLPRRVVFTRPVIRFPFPKAFMIAKIMIVFFSLPMWSNKITPTIIAKNHSIFTLPSRAIFACLVFRLPFSHTRCIAKILSSMINQSIYSLKVFTAIRTLDYCMSCQRFALYRTIIVFGFFDKVRLFFVRFFTVVTKDCIFTFEEITLTRMRTKPHTSFTLLYLRIKFFNVLIASRTFNYLVSHIITKRKTLFRPRRCCRGNTQKVVKGSVNNYRISWLKRQNALKGFVASTLILYHKWLTVLNILLFVFSGQKIWEFHL